MSDVRIYTVGGPLGQRVADHADYAALESQLADLDTVLRSRMNAIDAENVAEMKRHREVEKNWVKLGQEPESQAAIQRGEIERLRAALERIESGEGNALFIAKAALEGRP